MSTSEPMLVVVSETVEVLEPEEGAVFDDEVDTTVVAAPIVVTETAAPAATAEEKPVDHAHAHGEKSPSFHLLPNKETFHRVKDPLVLHRDKGEAVATHGEEGHEHVDGDETEHNSFHRTPNSESFHLTK